MDMDMIMNPGKYFNKGNVGYRLKDNPLFSVVRTTITKYNMLPILFDENLRTLRIQKDTAKESFGESMVGEVLGSYDPKRNSIVEPTDKNDLIHELFHMASNDSLKKDMGVIVDGFGESINEGITDMFSSFATLDEKRDEDKYEVRYPFEKLMAEFLGSLYGIRIFNNYFTNNGNRFYESFGVDTEKVKTIIGNLDRFTKAKNSFFDIKVMDFNEFTSSFIDTFNSFVDLVKDKKESYPNMYYQLLISMLNQNNEAVNVIKEIIKSSDYKNINNVLDVISNHAFNKEATL